MRSPTRKPRPPRIDVDYDAELITSDGGVIRVKVKDLSRDGFRVELDDDHVLIGEKVRLRAGRHGDLAAQIRWVTGSEAGGIFLEDPKLPNG